MKEFGRILTAMVTPFDSDLKVDYAAAEKLADYLVANGSDGLVVAGTTGESPTLTKEEKLELFRVVKNAVGAKAPIIAGTGSNSTADSIHLTKEAEKTGVDGVMLVGPYYNKPTQEGYFEHFRAVARETSLPIVVYNVPGRTGSNILPSTIVRLAEIANIVAVKEASGSLDQVTEIKRGVKPEFLVYSGDDSLTLPIMSVGGYGIISVVAHVVGPEMKAMIDAYLAGNVAKAAEIHVRLFAIFKALFLVSNPIPVKAAVNMMGINVGGVRLPLVAASDKELEPVKKALAELGKL